MFHNASRRIHSQSSMVVEIIFGLTKVLAPHIILGKLASPDLIRQLVACFKFIDSLDHHRLAVNISNDQ